MKKRLLRRNETVLSDESKAGIQLVVVVVVIVVVVVVVVVCFFSHRL